MSERVETIRDESAPAAWGAAPEAQFDQQPEIKVLYTREAETRMALDYALRLAAGLNSRVALVVLQVVPRPLPPESSPVSLEFIKGRVERLTARAEGEIEARIYLCRDMLAALPRVFSRSDLILLGGADGWFRRTDKRLGRELERLGYNVLHVPSEPRT